MSDRPILFFDSGIGGLTVLREARVKMPDRQIVYVADDAGFPYGKWPEESLKQRIITLFGQLIERYKPVLCVIACNTASTLVMGDLRQHFPDTLFVGTVPAIKPAAEQTRSGLISVLATPGTVKRAYTHDLVSLYASQCHVRLVGSQRLAGFAEDYLRGITLDREAVLKEILPCFVEQDGLHTDIVVLACTHYPFLINLFRKLAPWPVDWLDPAEAIAKRALSLLSQPIETQGEHLKDDVAYFTSGHVDFSTRRLLQGFGLHIDKINLELDITACSP